MNELCFLYCSMCFFSYIWRINVWSLYWACKLFDGSYQSWLLWLKVEREIMDLQLLICQYSITSPFSCYKVWKPPIILKTVVCTLLRGGFYRFTFVIFLIKSEREIQLKYKLSLRRVYTENKRLGWFSMKNECRNLPQKNCRL